MADLKTAFENLKASVALQQTVDASVLALVQGLKVQLTDLASQETINPADVQALADTLTAEQKNLSFAVTQGTGTPAAPGTPASPIFSAPIITTGGAITTDPVTPAAPVVTAPVVPAAPEVPVVVDPIVPVASGVQDAGSTDTTTTDTSSSLPSTPTSTDAPVTVTEPAAPVVDAATSTDTLAPVTVEVVGIDHSAEGQALMGIDLNAQGSQL